MVSLVKQATNKANQLLTRYEALYEIHWFSYISPLKFHLSYYLEYLGTQFQVCEQEIKRDQVGVKLKEQTNFDYIIRYRTGFEIG